jgi:hypothetical protein
MTIDDKTNELIKKVEKLVPLRINVAFDGSSLGYERLDTHEKGIEEKLVKILTDTPIEIKYDENGKRIGFFNVTPKEFPGETNALVYGKEISKGTYEGYYSYLDKNTN